MKRMIGNGEKSQKVAESREIMDTRLLKLSEFPSCLFLRRKKKNPIKLPDEETTSSHTSDLTAANEL